MDTTDIIFGLLIIYVVYRIFFTKQVDYRKDIDNALNNDEYKVKSRYD